MDLRGARVGDWKWVQHKDEDWLFDLSTDIGEQQDLKEARPDKYREVRAAFDAWRRDMDECEPRGPFKDF